METDINVGSIIKKFRTEKKMTLKELSELTQITSSMLSQIERGQANPSLNTIRTIAQTLDTPLFKFFMESDTEPAESHIVTPENRKHIISDGIEYEILTPTMDTTIEFMQLTLIPGAASMTNPSSHKGEEVALVTGGKFEIHIEDNIYIMNKGDSMRIPAQTKHCWKNPFDETAVLVFAITPPEF